jgi:hypothetical protein
MSPIEMAGQISLRWLVKRNKIDAIAISNFREKNGCSISEAKRILEDAYAPVLQQMIIDGGQQVWVTIPTVVVPHVVIPTSENT